MKFNDVTVQELKIEQWNGKTRPMVVWKGDSEVPAVAEVCGVYAKKDKTVWLARILGELVEADHVGEIPTLQDKDDTWKREMMAKLDNANAVAAASKSKLAEFKEKYAKLECDMNKYQWIERSISKGEPCDEGFIKNRLAMMYKDSKYTWNIEGPYIHVKFAPASCDPDSWLELWLENNMGMKLRQRMYAPQHNKEFFDD